MGKIMHMYHGTTGKDTNNAAELEGLWNGICISEQKNFYPLEAEWDSLILIIVAIRIQASTSTAKIASSWRLLSRLEQMGEWLWTRRSITFKHIRRTTNKVADKLANQGVNQQLPYFLDTLCDSNDVQLKNECTSLVQQDYSLPDAGE